MRKGKHIAVIIPAFNEEQAIKHVIGEIPGWIDDIIVVDNGSTDRTAEIAEANGACVIHEPRRGYGSACLAGINVLDNPDVVVFLDGDYSDYPGEMTLLVDPLLNNKADMVVGSRVLCTTETGALTLQQRFGNRLACTLINIFWKVHFTDLGPFRAIRNSALVGLDMKDRDYGWTVEMQIKAVRHGIRVIEVPVSYRKRVGISKVSGTVKGVIGAGTKIIGTIILSGLSALFENIKMKKVSDRLIIFTRYPEPGKTKTRLIPALGEKGAADMQRIMTLQTVSIARRMKKHHQISVDVHYEGGNENAMRTWLGRGIHYRWQSTGDLGSRMVDAFITGFKNRVGNVVIIGTDCPDLSEEVLRSAFSTLSDNDLVLGPAHDGGYYLIGMSRDSRFKAVPALFEGIKWGTGEVLSETVTAAETAGLSYGFVRTLHDVDRPEDLEVMERTQEKISVIIPTINEVENIDAVLSVFKKASKIEVIVVDGESTDNIAEKARNYNAEVLSSVPGRAIQMNSGARNASGDILLFLHADTLLPSGFDDMVRLTLKDPTVVCGAFELRIDSPMKLLRIIEKTTHFRAKWMHMPYGDQALFIKADIFREAGGFHEIPIMEDYEFLRRLKRLGKIEIVSAEVKTSARRWETVGFWRTTIINQIMIVAYHLGVSPSRLCRLYHGRK